MNKQLVTISKFLSLVLRHKPQEIGITLDSEGWVPVKELLAAAARHGRSISREQLDEVVATNDKRRFSFSPDGLLVRANQGHSVEVDLGLVPIEPPELLYHGTVQRFLDSIREKGLVRGNRHHVHLSADRDTADRVGHAVADPWYWWSRPGVQREGHRFFRSENGVWLTETVPPQYLSLGKGKGVPTLNTGPTSLSDHPARMARARLSLDGLSVGDAMGERLCYTSHELCNRRLDTAFHVCTDGKRRGTFAATRPHNAVWPSGSALPNRGRPVLLRSA